MSEEPAAKPVRRVLAGPCCHRMDAFLEALTPVDRRLLRMNATARTGSGPGALWWHVIFGIVAFILSLTTIIPLRLRYDWGRLVLWCVGFVVATGGRDPHDCR